MKQDNDKKDRSLGLSPTQVAGSALAAMSGAFFVSWAGTAGTLIGAAVGSVIATVGAATYTWSLRRTSEAAKRTAALVKERSLLTGTLPRSGLGQGPLREDGADRPVGPVEPGQPPSPVEEPAEIEPPTRRLDLPWVKVALASLAVMIAGMAGITAVEAITGKPIASLLGKDTGTGTTVGHIVGGNSSSTGDQHQSPTNDTPATQQPEPSSPPSQAPQQSVPSSNPDPSTAPSQSPAPPVESQAPGTGTGPGTLGQ